MSYKSSGSIFLSQFDSDFKMKFIIILFFVLISSIHSSKILLAIDEQKILKFSTGTAMVKQPTGTSITLSSNKQTLGKTVDFIFVMTYDLHGTWDVGLNFN